MEVPTGTAGETAARNQPLTEAWGARRSSLFPRDPALSAQGAGLRYVRDTEPGITRLKHGKTVRYAGPDSKPVSNETTLKRIRSLVIPPAWTDVWICRHPEGHLEAVGRDAKGRKQYRCHPSCRRQRDETKKDWSNLPGKSIRKRA